MAALAAGLMNLPYGYYMLLRLLVCGVCAYLADRDAQIGQRGWAWVLGGFAILYNPIFKMPLEKEIWTFANSATIVILAVHMWLRSSGPGVSSQSNAASDPSGSGP